ncbi:MAG: hypothetical protein M1838_003136 [Thelocarpon superellum]|nr:MAG: hypothetical protein M1838_003136 [Thelocarpon superellum]
MAIWPFAKKRKTAATGRERDGAPSTVLMGPRPYLGSSTQVGGIGLPSHKQADFTRELRHAATGLGMSSREAVTSSRSKPRNDSSHDLEHEHVLPPLNRDATSLGIFTENRGNVPSYYFHNPASHTSLAERRDDWQRPPTLRAKRNTNDSSLLRRKSTKRDRAREQEIRGLQSTVLLSSRPNTHSGSVLQRDSKKMHGALNRHLERPMSEISLPIPDSLHSSMSLTADSQGFKVRSRDLFSPRPTIRYSESTRYPGGSSSALPSRSNSRREKRLFTPEETRDHRTRIDELADDLDAMALRELMERDQRRREQKHLSDHEKLDRKLRRRAEKQQEEERRATASASSPQPSEYVSRGRDLIRPGRDQNFAARGERQLARSLDERDEMLITPSWLHDPSNEHLPLDPFTEGDEASASQPQQAITVESGKVGEEPVTNVVQSSRLSQASASPPSSPLLAMATQSPEAPPAPRRREEGSTELDSIDPDQRASGSSGRQPTVGSWTSLFRRSGPRAEHESGDRGLLTPSEFSNASRDSLSRQFPAVPDQVGFKRRSTPLARAKSKFREDLPELPMSPPYSRVQSIEPAPVLDNLQESLPLERAGSSLAERVSYGASSPSPYDFFADPSLKRQTEAAMSGHRSSEAPSLEGRAPSTVVSQSMASIDSEGSWLSGRPAKRSSQGPGPLRNSASSLQKRLQEFNDSGEDLALTEDEYLNRLTPANDLHLTAEPPSGARRQSSVAIASTDGEDDGLQLRHGPDAADLGTWHGAVGRKPTIVHHEALEKKSREGLLNDFRRGEEEEPTRKATSFEHQRPSFEFPTERGNEGSHERHVSAVDPLDSTS